MPGWITAAASRTGRAHLQEGTPCQDANYHVETGGKIIIAVADGAGSTPHGATGARIAARTTVRSIEKSAGSATTATMQAAAISARRAIECHAGARGHDPRDYHTTLLAAVHQNGTLTTLQIGDGAIVAGRLGIPGASGNFSLVSPPQQGEYANETNFLTGPDFLAHVDIRRFPGDQYDRISLMSDGLQRLALQYGGDQGPVPHQPFFQGVFRWLASQRETGKASSILRKLLDDLAGSGRAQDDLTLVLAQIAGERDWEQCRST